MYPPYDLMLAWDNMRLLGHPGSDSDETWWKLFPGVSRSFVNISGTKIAAKNRQKRQTKFSETNKNKSERSRNFKMEVFRHAEMCPRRISTRRIRIWGRKLPNLTVRVEKMRTTSDNIFGFLLIAHTGSHGFGPDLVRIFPRSLPQLSKQLRDQNNSQQQSKTSDQILREK